jgi:ceramide glucosyltransferase
LLLLGCWTYAVLAIIAAERYRRHPQPATAPSSGISILKPLAGMDDGLEDNLRSYFEQDYAPMELLFAVRTADDAPAQVVRALAAQYPDVSTRIVMVGDPPYLHDKVYKLQSLLDIAQYALVAMADSDIRVGRDFCRRIAAEFSAPKLAIETCPYRAVAGRSLWSRLEALNMNIDFSAGIFTAAMLEGVKFAVGPTIVARREVLEALGGIARFKDYVSSEDFMLGQTAAAEGFGVDLSSYIIEHRIGSEPMGKNFAHRIRWGRTTRRSRPAGYFGQFFTYPVSALICICFAFPLWKPLLAITVLLRIATAHAVSERTLGARVAWHLLPLSDLLTFVFWVAGFFGNTIQWRGRRYHLRRDGRLESRS